MSTLAEIYQRHANCDKGSVHSYIGVYERILEPYRNGPGNVLELGVFRGDSLRIWEEYFTGCRPWGVDVSDQPIGGMADLRPMIQEGTHRIVIMSCTNLRDVEAHFRGVLFSVIIDDASHNLCDQLAAYYYFRDKLAPSGLYVIEDVQDLDRTRFTFENIDLGKRVRIFDNRHVKQRYDDVLVAIGGMDL
jgi:hypothetical protein